MPEPQAAAPTPPEKTPATVAELRAAFPGDTDYTLSCVEGGLTLLEAQAGYADVLRAKLTAQSAEHEAAAAKLTADLAAASLASPAAALGVSSGTMSRDAGNPSDEWDAKLTAEIKRLTDSGSQGANRGLRLSRPAKIRARAADNVAKNNPGLHTAYLDAFNASRS